MTQKKKKKSFLSLFCLRKSFELCDKRGNSKQNDTVSLPLRRYGRKYVILE